VNFNEAEQDRFKMTIKRLISNLPSAIEVLKEKGKVNLAGQISRDLDNLTYWQNNNDKETNT
jgi:hypothetical protein